MAPSLTLREHVPLAPYTTFGIGGPARWFLDASTEQQALHAVQFAQKHNLPLLVLGGGSNLLIVDEGFPGLVIHMTIPGIDQHPASAGCRRFSVAAGENWDALVSLAVGLGYGGWECLAGIPGTVGGTPIQNVGAYGQEVAETIVSVRALDLTSLQFVDLPAAACAFGYRTSIFNTTGRGRYLVTRVHFELQAAQTGCFTYRDLEQHFKDWKTPPTPAQVAEAVRSIRRGKGMLLVPNDPDSRSAGSFFKNPILPRASLDRLAAAAGVPAETLPRFELHPADPGRVKVPAAWLVEKAGFHRGYHLGRASISSRHTLALVNAGDAQGTSASAREILALSHQIVGAVAERFQVHLEMEPHLVGFPSSLTIESPPV